MPAVLHLLHFFIGTKPIWIIMNALMQLFKCFDLLLKVLQQLLIVCHVTKSPS